MKIIEIKDGKLIKKFQVNLLKGLPAYNFLIDLSQLIIDTPEATAKDITQFLFMTMGSGEEVEGSTTNGVNSVLNSVVNNQMEFIIKLVIGAIQKLNQAQREQLLSITLANCVYMNGEAKMTLSLDDVSIYIDSPITLIMLIKEFVTYNIGEMFPKGD